MISLSDLQRWWKWQELCLSWKNSEFQPVHDIQILTGAYCHKFTMAPTRKPMTANPRAAEGTAVGRPGYAKLRPYFRGRPFDVYHLERYILSMFMLWSKKLVLNCMDSLLQVTPVRSEKNHIIHVNFDVRTLPGSWFEKCLMISRLLAGFP